MATKNERADYGSLTPSMDDLSTGYLSKISRMRNELLAQYDLDKDSKLCPHCKSKRLLKFFGTRVQRDATTGIPLRVVFQSYCETCRAGKSPGAKSKKGKAGKKPVQKKVTAKVKSGEAKVVTPSVEPTPVPVEADAVVAAGMALLAEEGVVSSATPTEVVVMEPTPEVTEEDEFDTAPSTVETFAATVGPALDAIKVEAPVVEAKEEVAPISTPVLSEGEYVTPCKEILPKGVFCNCPTCKAARA